MDTLSFYRTLAKISHRLYLEAFTQKIVYPCTRLHTLERLAASLLLPVSAYTRDVTTAIDEQW